jgi:hypothetical protein
VVQAYIPACPRRPKRASGHDNVCVCGWVRVCILCVCVCVCVCVHISQHTGRPCDTIKWGGKSQTLCVSWRSSLSLHLQPPSPPSPPVGFSDVSAISGKALLFRAEGLCREPALSASRGLLKETSVCCVVCIGSENVSLLLKPDFSTLKKGPYVYFGGESGH